MWLVTTLVEGVDGCLEFGGALSWSGRRLFGEASDKTPGRLVQARTLGGGLAYLTYERVGVASYSSGTP